MNDNRIFIDTNIFVYLYSETDFRKRAIAQKIRHFQTVISTQVLNEFCNALLHKKKAEPAAVETALNEIMNSCELTIVTKETVRSAVQLHKQNGYHFYDCLIIASALESDCSMLFSEDMQDGQVINNRLTIRNIFA